MKIKHSEHLVRFQFPTYLLKNLRLFYAPENHQLSHCIVMVKKEKKDLSYVVVHKAIQILGNKICCERKCKP